MVRPRMSPFRAIAAVVLSNVLEWYDFIVYSYFAVTIAAQFFPAANETASLLAAFAAFGVGFIFRPLGAIVIGAIGDRKGRKTALVLTIMLMAAGTSLIGLLPTYETIGIAAPLFLVLARLIKDSRSEANGAPRLSISWNPRLQKSAASTEAFSK